MKKESIHVLGIDTSCDDTGVAVVQNGRIILSSRLACQIELHQPFGGVVPEVASRAHAHALLPLLREALKEAELEPQDLDAVAVTQGPGLVGCLLVGISLAKSFAFGCGLPLVAVNHLHAHLFSAAFGLADEDVPFPHVALLVSGGHTAVYFVGHPQSVEQLAATRDDAAGEAFDKVGHLLGLPYPGGPAIEKQAKEWQGELISFPRPLTGPQMAFSFSGLKTAVARYVETHQPLSTDEVNQIAASFQQAVADVLIEKTLMAAERRRVATITLTGGVAANSTIRGALESAAAENRMRLIVPPLSLCTDNGAMVAGLGTILFRNGERAAWDVDAMP